jgi:uncharacterized protein YxjI
MSFTLTSMAEPFTMTDASGQTRYQVATTDYGERLSLRDASGRELAAVVHGPRVRGVQVRINGEEAAMVRARGPFRARYQADMRSGTLRTHGEVYDGYALCPGSDYGKASVFVTRRPDYTYTSLPMKMHVVIADREDPVLLTAVVLAVEHLIYERGYRQWGRRPAFPDFHHIGRR